MFGTERGKMLVRLLKMEGYQFGDRLRSLEEKIERERKKLNSAIQDKEDYDVIYKLSLVVDKLIEEYIQIKK